VSAPRCLGPATRTKSFRRNQSACNLVFWLLYCVRCGKQIPEDALICPYCGAGVPGIGVEPKAKPSGTPPLSFPLKSGLDALAKDQSVQQYWARRLVAFVIDSIILSLAAGVLAFIATFPALLQYGVGYRFSSPFSWVTGQFPFLLGIISVLYFALTEYQYGHTLGKSLMGFRVTADDGRGLTLEKAFIRNISKIHGVLLLLDLVIGLATETDYRKKFSDKYAETIVVPR
jgi:uncharacterized RDD family membrane protein YckC